MGNGCISKALIVLAFGAVLCLTVHFDALEKAYGETLFAKTVEKETAVQAKEIENTVEAAEKAPVQMKKAPAQITDLTEAFSTILRGADRDFIAGYRIDETFLMWLAAQYGDGLIRDLAYCVLDGNMDFDVWYELTGESLHVLWLKFCRDTGFQDDCLEKVYWQETKETSQTVISFTGDFNLSEDWCTTKYMMEQPDGIYDCISPELLDEMRSSDILLMNNEFTYSSRGTALEGKAYTFRAQPEMVELLSVFGTDIVSLANNHVYDYGRDGLMDTLWYLEQAGIPYSGAGKNLEEASSSVCFVANGRKIAIISASEIERTTKYTKEATDTECGVLKTLRPEKFLDAIRKAEEESDYVIAVVHWGTEGSLKPDGMQERLAIKIAEAGADVIIGGHPHRLQGVDYVAGVPVAYSLGNFWFSDGTLYTTLAQVVIPDNGKPELRFLPCIQQDLTTRLLVDEGEKDEFYHYLAAISENIGIDADGYVYDKSGEAAGEVVYDSKTSRTKITGARDNEGNAIDIVGNRK